MDFSFSDEQNAIVEAVGAIVGKYGDDYWLARDRDGRFPEELFRDLAEGGCLGIAVPEEYGGSGLGVAEAALMMTVARHGGAMAAASCVHMNVFGSKAITVHGAEDQKQRWLPVILRGEYKMCFGVTEPDTGLDTTRLATRAVRDGDHYVVHGQKVWTSTAQVAEKIMLLARTAPRDEGDPTGGLSLFFADLDRSAATVAEIDKMGRKAVDSNVIHFDGMRIPVVDRIGEEGRGVPLYPGQRQSRAHPGRRRGRGHRSRRAGPRRPICARPPCVPAAGRAEPVDPASVGGKLDRTGSRPSIRVERALGLPKSY